MARITISGVPDVYVATIASAVREAYGASVAGLADDDALRYALKTHLKDLAQRYRQRHANDAGVPADAALAAKEEALAATLKARKSNEASALADNDAQFQEVT